MVESPWEFFDLSELKCKCGQCNSTGLEMSDSFMQMMVAIREKLGFPLNVSSAYRCPHYNNIVAETGLNGPHTTGKALDIVLRGEPALRLIGAAIDAGMMGVGVSQKTYDRFIHLDMCESPQYPRPNIWSY